MENVRDGQIFGWTGTELQIIMNDITGQASRHIGSQTSVHQVPPLIEISLRMKWSFAK